MLVGPRRNAVNQFSAKSRLASHSGIDSSSNPNCNLKYWNPYNFPKDFDDWSSRYASGFRYQHDFKHACATIQYSIDLIEPCPRVPPEYSALPSILIDLTPWTSSLGLVPAMTEIHSKYCGGRLPSNTSDNSLPSASPRPLSPETVSLFNLSLINSVEFIDDQMVHRARSRVSTCHFRYPVRLLCPEALFPGRYSPTFRPSLAIFLNLLRDLLYQFYIVRAPVLHYFSILTANNFSPRRSAQGRSICAHDAFAAALLLAWMREPRRLLSMPTYELLS
ncbi:hypothetical protein FB451DRAFT_1193207 [Mycena latifolia]|nr:hypothetical protein FB451DRAFT_1193207 [Mycena latifolia]